jgi:hypothetical protein
MADEVKAPIMTKGGRTAPFHVGEMAVQIGGLGEAIMLSAGIGVLAQREGFPKAYMHRCATSNG